MMYSIGMSRGRLTGLFKMLSRLSAKGVALKNKDKVGNISTRFIAREVV